jgi:disulfide bond formation protein DsbB
MDGVRLLSILTLVSNIAFVLALALFLASKVAKSVGVYWRKAEKYLTKNSVRFALIIGLVATLGSLYFSEIRGFEPCKLCWLQRIFMYPLPIILGISLYKKTKEVWNYVLPMAVVGLGIAAYHYYYQVTGSSLIPCSTIGFSVSCSERFFTYWGYITIPWMSLSAFALIAALMLLARKSSNKKS